MLIKCVGQTDTHRMASLSQTDSYTLRQQRKCLHLCLRWKSNKILARNILVLEKSTSGTVAVSGMAVNSSLFSAPSAGKFNILIRVLLLGYLVDNVTFHI